MISAMKNKYVIRSKISQKKFGRILRLFCEDLEASKISSLTGVKEQCLCRLFRALRVRLVEYSENSSKVCGEISSSLCSHRSCALNLMRATFYFVTC